MCCRASARWPRTTGRWDGSSWSVCPPRRAACRRVEVAFDIDANGIVNVTAKDRWRPARRRRSRSADRERPVEGRRRSGWSRKRRATRPEDQARRDLIEAAATRPTRSPTRWRRRGQREPHRKVAVGDLSKIEAAINAEVRRPVAGRGSGGAQEGDRGAAARVARDAMSSFTRRKVLRVPKVHRVLRVRAPQASRTSRTVRSGRRGIRMRPNRSQGQEGFQPLLPA